HARTGRAVAPEPAAEGTSGATAAAADLVLRLEGTDAESLQLGQLVQDVRGRRDRIGAQEQRQARAPGGGDEAVGQRGIAGDVAVGAWLQRGWLDLVLDREGLGGLAIVPACLEGCLVGL